MRKTRIVIIGGGFAGAFAARQLRKSFDKETKIELINDTNYFVFQPLLPEVVSGTLNASDVVTPLRHMLPGIRIRMAEVRSINFDGCTLTIAQGTKKIPQIVHYDQLVLAMGQKANLSILQGFEDHSFPLKNVADAHALRNHIIECLEHADITENKKLKKRLLTFIVAGAGFSGVETVGEISEMLAKTIKHYPNISAQDINCMLVQLDKRILPELTEKLASYAHEKLSKRGIKIYVDTAIDAATATSAILGNGERIFTATLITTIGNGPTDLVKSLPLELKWGKIRTDEFLRVKGLENVWAIGDSALIPIQGLGNLEYVPSTAQFAVREASRVANNIYALMNQMPLKEFFYKPKGLLASIGNYSAVADLFGLRISGFFAWVIWRAFYIAMLPKFFTKVRVAFSWLLDFFAPRNIVQIQVKEQVSSCKYMHYLKGDVLFRPGQICDGLYTVVTGRLESRTVRRQEEDFVHIVGPGEHWGEREIAGDFETDSTLTALEDTKVLVLKRDVFNKLRESIPAMNKYFSQIDDHRNKIKIAH